MIAHLPRCLALDPTGRYACNCGADAQNALARRLDALPPVALTPPADTPLRAVARMLRRLAASSCHHDAARHLLASAGDAVELATGLAPEEAIRVLDAVEPAEDAANATTHLREPAYPKTANRPTHLAARRGDFAGNRGSRCVA